MQSLEPIFRFLTNLPVLLWVSFVELVFLFVPMSWYAKDVSNDIVLITGAGSGLGQLIAIEYAKQNASLVLWDINADGLRNTKQMVEKEHKKLTNAKSTEGNNRARFCKAYIADVSDREQVHARAKQVYRDLNEGVDSSNEKERYVTVLVNNAGIYHGLYLMDLKDEQIERIFKINIMAHFWTVRAFLPKMIENQSGHIVEIASMGGLDGMLKQVDYCATKFATVGFEESLNIELDNLGLADKIHTTAVCPMFFRSNLFTGYNDKASALMSARYVAQAAVMGIRCNKPRIILPPSMHILNLLKPITPRRAAFLWTRILGYDEGIKEIKGAASAS